MGNVQFAYGELLERLFARQQHNARMGTFPRVYTSVSPVSINNPGFYLLNSSTHPGTGTYRPFVLCPMTKAGYTQQVGLMLRLTWNQSDWLAAWERVAIFNISDHRWHNPQFFNMFTWPTSQETYLEALYAPTLGEALQARHDVRHVLFVRNPYTRLLSFYLDKVARRTPDTPYPPYEEEVLRGLGLTTGYPPASFEATVVAIHRQWAAQPGFTNMALDQHYRPQTYQCGILAGVKYHIVVRLEDLPQLYPCLVAELGLGPYVDSLWAPTGRNRSYDCFYKPSADLPCDWWRHELAALTSAREHASNAAGNTSAALLHARRHANGHRQAAGGGDNVSRHHRSTDGHRGRGLMASSVGVLPQSSHATQADAKTSYFYTPRAAALATQIYAWDLVAFGYEPWPGPPAPFAHRGMHA